MRQELRLVFNKRLIGAITIMLITFSGYSAIEWMFVYHLDVSIRPASIQQVLGGIFFGGVMIMMPLCAALPASIMQVEELNSAFTDLRVMRLSMKEYIRNKFVAAFVSGAAVMGIAFCIHTIIWNVVATPNDIAVNDYLAIPFSEDCIYYAWQGVFYSLPIYLWMDIMMAFCGGMWAMVGITTALYLKDKLLSLAVPFCIYYLWHFGMPKKMFGIQGFPHPADLYNDALTLDVVYKSLLTYAGLGFICLLLYAIKLERRYQRDT